MALTRIFTVTVERGHSDWWVLEAPDVGAVSQVRRLDQVENEMREAIAHLAGLLESEVEVDVRATLPEDCVEHVGQARRLRAEAEAASRRAAEESRLAARSLRNRGLTFRDVGSLPTARRPAAQRLNATRRYPVRAIDLVSTVILSHQNRRLRGGGRRDGAGRMGAEWVWRA